MTTSKTSSLCRYDKSCRNKATLLANYIKPNTGELSRLSYALFMGNRPVRSAKIKYKYIHRKVFHAHDNKISIGVQEKCKSKMTIKQLFPAIRSSQVGCFVRGYENCLLRLMQNHFNCNYSRCTQECTRGLFCLHTFLTNFICC